MTPPRFKYARISEFEYLLKYIVWGVLITGVLLRLAVYLQCDSLFADEADVARNIFERSYITLTQPLNYYQYDPPIFLWIVKTCTVAFGLSEYAFRLFPLFCGMLSLGVFYSVLKYFTNYRGAWYAILLLALGPIYIHYGNAIKQYVPDMLVWLTLVWLALKNEVSKKSNFKLFIIWAIAGSVAIWSSMPSVFILAGVGVYYFAEMVKEKDFSRLGFLLAAGIIWLGQFAFYYILILRPQANSEYLQNFHKNYFYYWPANFEILSNDVELFFSFIATAGGHLVLALLLNIACIIIAIFYWARVNLPRLLLVVIPLTAVLFAAALHQYTLIPRVTLFAMPLLLILIATGLQQLLSFGPIFFRLVIVVFAIINVVNFNAIKNFVTPMQQQEMKTNLDFLLEKQITGKELYVEQLAVPAYVYYTNIHPQKLHWAYLLGADTLNYGVNFDSLSKTFPAKSAMLYSWNEERKINDQQRAIRANVTLIDSNIVKGG